MKKITAILCMAILASVIGCAGLNGDQSLSSQIQWTQVGGIPVGGPGTITPLVVSGQMLVTGGYGAVYQTANDGAKWTKAGSGLPVTVSIAQLVACGSWLIANTGSSPVFRSADNGKTWTPGAGLPDSCTVSSVAVNGGILFVTTVKNAVPPGAAHYGIYRSTDNGATWSVTDIAFQNHAGLTLISAGNGYLFAHYDSTNGIDTNPIPVGLRSSNNGTTWTTVTNIPFLAMGGPNSFASVGSNLYAATYNGIFSSTNSGATWSQTTVTSSANNLVASGNFLFAISDGRIIYSGDYGATFMPVWDDVGNGYPACLSTADGYLFFNDYTANETESVWQLSLSDLSGEGS